MSVGKRVAAVAAATMMSIGVVSAGAPAASAQAGDVSVQAIKSRGPFYDYSGCVVVQSEYRRYYTITRTCNWVPNHFWWFSYDGNS